MAKYKLVVMSKPVEGREADYNNWYQNVHLRDIVKCGFKAAQRFRLAEDVANTKPFPYMAIYEAEVDDPKVLIQKLMQGSSNGEIAMSDSLDPDLYVGMYQDFGARVGS